MDTDSLADVYKALGDSTRLKIISLLNVRDFCVCELVPLFSISQPAVSKHMSRLKNAGLVTETRKGMWVFYSLNKARLSEIGVSLANLPDPCEDIRRVKREGLLVQCK